MNISNITQETITERISELFKILGHPARLDILLEIGRREACVCHLEAMLDQRQAYISQQLMVLRDAGLLSTRQEGRYVFYNLRDPETLTLIHKARKMLGLPEAPERTATSDCPCPKCRST
ncbi:MAG: winged helix-turn-helix transcriptional regulator [Anaerolineales bacterium]|nr:winged helix-turn-helix transcriptional regulator [Anaerolineales bacterium]